MTHSAELLFFFYVTEKAAAEPPSRGDFLLRIHLVAVYVTSAPLRRIAKARSGSDRSYQIISRQFYCNHLESMWRSSLLCVQWFADPPQRRVCDTDVLVDEYSVQ